MRVSPIAGAALLTLSTIACSHGYAIADDDAYADGKWVASGGAHAQGSGGKASGNPGAGGAPNSGVANGGTAGSGNVPFDDVCDPYEPRTQPPELLIGPTGLESKLLGLIDQAQNRVDVMMYQLSRQSFISSLINAHDRGVVVRVLLDPDQSGNAGATSHLSTAGIDVRQAWSAFEHAHAKIIFVDDVAAAIMSANLNDYSMETERNYGVIDRDPADLDDLARIFDADFDAKASPSLDCTRLIVSPVNARARMVALVEGAQTSLDLAVMYLSDKSLKSAVIARAQAGVTVRVLLADPAWISSNVSTATDLAAAQIKVRYLKSWELHAKLVVADQTAFIGSENLSWTALNKNREIGLFISEDVLSANVKAQFSSDWAAGSSAP